MSKYNSVTQSITSLHKLILSQREKRINPDGIKQLNAFIAELKNIGLVDGIELNGEKGRYFLIDGLSWQTACQHLGHSVAPSLIAWEESEFFEFLKSGFMAKNKTDNHTK
ncbi:hypothetical protein ACFL6U_13035 [Planctomycetota bacterium]